MESSVSSYLQLLRSVDSELEQLIELTRRKFAAVQQGDLATLDEIMNKEQAMTLALRGMEQKRLSLLRELGLSDVPLRQLADHVPDSDRETARQIIAGIDTHYRAYQDCSKQTRALLEQNLREIDHILSAIPPVPESGAAQPHPAAATPPSSSKTDFHV